MRTRGQSAKTEMEPVEVFARIKTVSNTEVSKSIFYLWIGIPYELSETEFWIILASWVAPRGIEVHEDFLACYGG